MGQWTPLNTSNKFFFEIISLNTGAGCLAYSNDLCVCGDNLFYQLKQTG